jgi:stage II sporulation protein P
MMKKIHVRIRLKIYPILWSIMIIAAIYLLLRFAMITFTEEMGQAGFMNALSKKLCVNLMESGSPLLKYSADEDGELYAFPLNLFNNSFALGDFIEDDTAVMVNAKDVVTDYSGYHPFHEDSSLKEENNSVDQRSSEETANGDTTSEDTGSDNSTSDDIKENQPSGSISIFSIKSDQISEEYLLTNGAVIKSSQTGDLIGEGEYFTEHLQINYEKSDLHEEDTQEVVAQPGDSIVETVTTDSRANYTLEKMKDVNYLVRTFYIVDASTTISESIFNGEEMLAKDMTIKQNSEKPQILIYHTHSQEGFVDSRKGKVEDTVVGVGTYLTKILEEDYGYNVIHDKSTYDIVNGSLDRNVAYSQAEDGVTQILKENPSIEVVIDLHRNSGEAKSVMIDGKKTAQVMLFNGLSRDQNGPIVHLDNPNLQENLAFSLQLQLKSVTEYPGLFKKNYLKSLRFNLHLRPKALLVELGTVNNTVDEAMNAMPPFAKVLDKVLKGEEDE